MPRIYVRFNELSSIGKRFSTISSRINSINNRFKSTVNRLDFDIKSRSNISMTANNLSRQLNDQQSTLKRCSQFISQATDRYRELDEQDFELTIKRGYSSGSGSSNAYRNPGVAAATVAGITGAGALGGGSTLLNRRWVDYGKKANKAYKNFSAVYKNYKNYNKIGRAVGGKTAAKWALKKQLGLSKVGRVSQAKNFKTRFYNNWHNPNLKTGFGTKFTNAAKNFTGKNGFGKAVSSWGGAILGIGTSYLDNKDEQARSGGTMSDGRVIAETVIEAGTDAAVTAGISSVVGTVVLSACAASPPGIVVTAVTGAAVLGFNALVNAATGQPISEWASDAVFKIGDIFGNLF